MSTVGSTPSLPLMKPARACDTLCMPRLVNFHAMYSSVLGGIVTDPAFMVLPLDDHMVHRGHAVFDTAMIVNGKLYQLRRISERLLRSAEMARLQLPHTPAQLRQIIIDTVAASRQRDASIRYWLSAGPGGFGLAPGECVNGSFYVMIFRAQPEPERSYTRAESRHQHCADQAPFARVKSTNYLPNALVIMEAKDHGADNGIFIDHRGMVGESSNMNVACVTQDRVLWHPTFDTILTGITVQRVLQLAQRLVEQGDLRAYQSSGSAGSRSTRRRGDADARQFHQGRPYRAMGRPADRRWHTWSHCQKTPRPVAGGHAGFDQLLPVPYPAG